MCSIGGFIASRPISAQSADSLCTALLYYGKDRGEQSGGVYANGILAKRAMDPFEFAQTAEFSNVFKKPTISALIHTRMPTCGGRGDDQAQPFRAGRTISVHNGWFVNTYELKKLWEIKKESGVDSELVTQFVNAYGIRKLPAFLKSLSGAAAFGILHEEQMYLMRDGNPTHWTTLDFGDLQIFVFASTGRMLANAIRHAWLIPSDHPIRETKEGILFRADPVKGLEKMSDKVSSKSYGYGSKYRVWSNGKWQGHDWGFDDEYSTHAPTKGGLSHADLQHLRKDLGDYADLINDSTEMGSNEASSEEKYDDIRYFTPNRGSDKKD